MNMDRRPEKSEIHSEIEKRASQLRENGLRIPSKLIGELLFHADANQIRSLPELEKNLARHARRMLKHGPSIAGRSNLHRVNMQEEMRYLQLAAIARRMHKIARKTEGRPTLADTLVAKGHKMGLDDKILRELSKHAGANGIHTYEKLANDVEKHLKGVTKHPPIEHAEGGSSAMESYEREHLTYMAMHAVAKQLAEAAKRKRTRK